MPRNFRVRAALHRAMAGSVMLLAMSALACGKKDAAPVADAPPTVTKDAAKGIEVVEVTTTGVGKTKDEAIRDGLVRAIEQVHGRAISVSTVSQELGTIESTKDVKVVGLGASKTQSVTMTAGGKRLEESTGGLATSIKVLEEKESRGGWSVKVAVGVARYSPPNNKVGVVIGRPRGTGSVKVDDAAAGVLTESIGQALSSAPGIAILDRSSDPALEEELSSLESGATPATAAIKAGQQQSAQFVVLVSLSALKVNRNARMMRTTQKEIVSYNGEVSATYRVVHVSSRQVMASGKAHAERASEEALRDNVDADAWKREMLAEVGEQLASGILDAMAPVRVIEVAATADASGGFAATVNAGQARLTSGKAYDVLVIGDAVTDPASGETLGRRERPCCTFTATQVDERVTFGTLNKKAVLSAGEVLQLRLRKKD